MSNGPSSGRLSSTGASEERGDGRVDGGRDVFATEEAVHRVLELAEVFLLEPPVADRRAFGGEPGRVDARHVVGGDLDAPPVRAPMCPRRPNGELSSTSRPREIASIGRIA
jgi:hypothetical protein